MESIWIASKLVTTFNSNQLWKLSYYVAIKKAHKSGNDLKIKELSVKIGCSYNSLKARLEEFETQGLIRIEDKKLHFVSTRKLKWEKGTKHVLKINKVVKRKQYIKFQATTVKDLKLEIQGFVGVTSSLYHQENRRNKQSDKIDNPMHNGIAQSKIAEKLHRSTSTGQRLVKKLRIQNKITVTPVFQSLGYMSFSYFNAYSNNGAIPSHSRWFNGSARYQIYSEMALVKEKVETPQEVSVMVVEKTNKRKVSKLKQADDVPFFMERPKGFFDKGYLIKLGYSKKQISDLFIVEAISIYKKKDSVMSKNVNLMSFKSFNLINNNKANTTSKR